MDLTVTQGTTYEMILTIKDGAVPPVPIDITSWVFAGQVREFFYSPDAAADFTFEIQDQVTQTGQVIVTLSAAETAAIPAKGISTPYSYEIQATFSGTVRSLLQGTLNLLAGAVKP